VPVIQVVSLVPIRFEFLGPVIVEALVNDPGGEKERKLAAEYVLEFGLQEVPVLNEIACVRLGKGIAVRMLRPKGGLGVNLPGQAGVSDGRLGPFEGAGPPGPEWETQQDAQSKDISRASPSHFAPPFFRCGTTPWNPSAVAPPLSG